MVRLKVYILYMPGETSLSQKDISSTPAAVPGLKTIQTATDVQGLIAETYERLKKTMTDMEYGEIKEIEDNPNGLRVKVKGEDTTTGIQTTGRKVISVDTGTYHVHWAGEDKSMRGNLFRRTRTRPGIALALEQGINPGTTPQKIQEVMRKKLSKPNEQRKWIQYLIRQLVAKNGFDPENSSLVFKVIQKGKAQTIPFRDIDKFMDKMSKKEYTRFGDMLNIAVDIDAIIEKA